MATSVVSEGDMQFKNSLQLHLSPNSHGYVFLPSSSSRKEDDEHEWLSAAQISCSANRMTPVLRERIYLFFTALRRKSSNTNKRVSVSMQIKGSFIGYINEYIDIRCIHVDIDISLAHERYLYDGLAMIHQKLVCWSTVLFNFLYDFIVCLELLLRIFI